MLYLLMGPEQYYLSLMDDFETIRNFTAEAAERIEKYVKKLPMDLRSLFKTVAKINEMESENMRRIVNLIDSRELSAVGKITRNLVKDMYKNNTDNKKM